MDNFNYELYQVVDVELNKKGKDLKKIEVLTHQIVTTNILH